MNTFKRFFYTLLILVGCFSCGSSDKNSIESINVIPLPQQIEMGMRSFQWKTGDALSLIVSDSSLDTEANYLLSILEKGLDTKISITSSKSNIKLLVDPEVANEEGYVLAITPNNIEIRAKSGQGIFYGIQTLLQLFPAEIYQANGIKDEFSLPTTTITDAPEFKYRGMHLDVSRNFSTKEDVMKYIDIISMYKFNTFHWHLTDGAGWRIEIKKYPELTRKTAFRAQKTWKEFWNEGKRKFVDKGTPNAYGGYYTQEDIKEVVAYAAQRHVTIIPEIEVPAHSEEVFVAYPQLSCSGIPYKDSDFCAGNDETFTFIEDVLAEVIELFPSEYIHIGGDEAGKSAWKTCPKCKKRMQSENLKDVDELQSYFVKRVSAYLKSRNKKLIGWDEIIEGGLAEDATVMLWRDRETAIKAAEKGHDIIMTPGSHCYLDYYQADPTTEIEAIGGFLPLRKVYSFDVVPEGAIAERFIGGQGNIWVEYINTFEHVQYMAFPRALAIAESVWTKKDKKDWNNFKVRLDNQLKRLTYLDVNYHHPSYEIELFQKVDTINKTITVTLGHEQISPEIRYTTDGTNPDNNSALFIDSLVLNTGANLAVAIIKNGQAQLVNKRNIGYHKAIGKKVIYNKKWTSYPAGGETALTDGLLGGYTYSDQLWQGFTSDLDIIIDCEEVIDFNSFNARFMQLIGPGVYMPEFVEITAYLEDPKTSEAIKIKNDISRDHDRLIFKDFSYEGAPVKARYIHIKAKNLGGFIFTDEIVIN